METKRFSINPRLRMPSLREPAAAGKKRTLCEHHWKWGRCRDCGGSSFCQHQ